MLTQTDIKFLIDYFSKNYVICQFRNGESLFTELLLKKDVYTDDTSVNNYKELL